MEKEKFNIGKTFLIGFGFFGVMIAWSVYNSFVPLFLANNFNLNAAMIGLVALIVPGFTISGFWTAVGAAIIVGLVSWAASTIIGNSGRVERFAARR